MYDYRSEKLNIFDTKLQLEANTTGSFQFKIYNNHLYFDKINKLSSIIKIYQKDRLIFRGRVLEDTTDFYKAKNVDCEGELAFLLDSIYRPFDLRNQTISIKQFLTDLINNHNSQVQDFQKFILGDITVEDPNKKINFSSDTALKTWDIIKTRLIDNYGGYLYITYNEYEMPILNYLVKPPNTSVQTIQFGQNMLDLSNLISGSEIFTAILPYGAKLKDENGNDTEERLTIKSVNGGIDYIYDEAMVKQYGLIFADPSKTTWDDVTTASNLLTKAKETLADGIQLIATIELKAIDLSNICDIQAFHFLDYIKILSVYHSIDKVYLLEKLEIDLFNPQNTTITLGETYKTLTDVSKQSNTTIAKVEKIEKDYVTNAKVTSLVTETIEQSSLIEQKAEKVVISAMVDYVAKNDFTSYQETNSAELQVIAEQIIANFTTTTSSIENVDGDLQQKYEELKSYIRGYQNDNGQPVVELGEAQSTIKLKLENDEIYFDVNGQKKFYLTADGQIVFRNAVFEETTEVGNGFGFVPRTNGNLSFKKVRR